MHQKFTAAAVLVAAASAWAYLHWARSADTPAAEHLHGANAGKPATDLANSFSAAPPAAARSRAPLPPLPDNVIEFIGREYGSSAVTRTALFQIAAGWNRAIHNVENASDAKTAGDAISRGIACALSRGVLERAGISPQAMIDRIDRTRGVMLGSREATQAYLHFQSLAGGQYFEDPGANPCGFDPGSLPH